MVKIALILFVLTPQGDHAVEIPARTMHECQQLIRQLPPLPDGSVYVAECVEQWVAI